MGFIINKIMSYEIKDTYVYGKILAKNGKPVIVNYDNAEKLTQRFNGTVWKLPTGRYMIKLPETVKSLDECDCEIVGQEQPNGQLMPQSYNEHPDHEVQMARQELYRTAKLAIMLHEMLRDVGENQGLEGWVQRKLTRAADYIESVFDYLDYEMRYPSEMTEEDTTMQTTPQNPNQPKTGGTGKPPGLTQTPDLIKMAYVDQRGNIQGKPIMVTPAQVKQNRAKGMHVLTDSVIGENASGGASSAGGIAVGAMNGGAGSNNVGSLFGGTYNQKKKKRKVETSGETGPKFTGYWKGTDRGPPGNKLVGGD